MKSNWVSVPERFASDSFISEIVPVVWQTMAVQLQRFLRLVRYHELRDEEGERLFFHLMRASACVVGDDVILTGSKESKRI